MVGRDLFLELDLLNVGEFDLFKLRIFIFLMFVVDLGFYGDWGLFVLYLFCNW